MKSTTGKFVWFEYVGDEKKAQGFLGELFGWKAQSVPVGGKTYSMIAVGDLTIGGYDAANGAPAHWRSHLGVADARATTDQVAKLGGKVLMPATKIGEFGTMALVTDPLGGTFALWQTAKPDGNADYKGTPNTFCWNELSTKEPMKSVAFYTAIGGFADKPMDMPGGTYHVLESEGQPRAGVHTPPAPMPQAWLPYVQVTDCDATTAKAKRLGATVIVGGEDIPGVGRFGLFADPQGAMLGVLQPSADAKT